MKKNLTHKQKLADVAARLKQLQETVGEFDQLKRAKQVEEAGILLHEAYALYDRKADRTAEEKLWKEAARFNHWLLDEAYPPDFDDRFNELRSGDVSGLETAVRFLEDDPWMFRSGYMKAYLIKFMIRLEISEEQMVRLRKAVLKAIEFRDRREFRWYCKLAKKIQNRDFRNDVEHLITSDDAGIRRRARWVLSAITHNADFHMQRGMKQYTLKQYTDAIGDFTRAILLEPASTRAYLWRGISHARLRQFSEAISDLTSSLDVSKSKYPERYSYKHNGRHLMWMRYPSQPDLTHRWLGWIHAELLDYPKAELAYSQALEVSPNDSLAFCGRGRARFNQKNFDAAKTDLEQSTELDASNSEAYFLLGLVHLEQGAHKLAIASLMRAIELNPEYIYSHLGLSEAFFNLSNYQEAYEAADVAISLQNDSASALCCRGKSLVRLGEYGRGIVDLSKSIESDSNTLDGEHFYWRAEAYEAIGEKELAFADRKSAADGGFKMDGDEPLS